MELLLGLRNEGAPLLAAVLLFCINASASATTLYVDINNPTPVSPYTNWVTAATNIQDAVDAAMAGDEVVVSNCVYQAGGRLASGTPTTNRLVLDKAVTVRSLNGPAVTIILGQPALNGGNGNGAVRCAYLADGATLSGFTLTNGATVITGSGDLGGGVFCAFGSAVVTNCILTGNQAGEDGGGASGGTLFNCQLTGNRAFLGGGGRSSTLNNCTLSSNSATYGGGAYSCLMTNCTVVANSAAYGGGGGVYGCTLDSCIVYYNRAPSNPNWSGGVLNYCCTTPVPGGGVGNTDADPQLASLSHLSALSPCLAAGDSAAGTGVDIDGELWAKPPAIGCDEYVTGAVTGPLSVSIQPSVANVAAGVALPLTALISGRPSASVWDFGDGTVVSNWPCASHVWGEGGDYTVTLTAYNESNPAGVSATALVHAQHVVRYVALDSSNPQVPYTSWEAAATNIQDAVDVSLAGDEIIVNDGVYRAGSRLISGTSTTNRVAVDKAVKVHSVNGPTATVILGEQALGGETGAGTVRCVYLASGAVLAGFTLTNGATSASSYDGNGGGACCESGSAVLTNCILAGNCAYSGGGAYEGTLYKCALTGNSANIGGGAQSSTLNNCTLTGNRAIWHGGGAQAGTLNNCALTANSAWAYGGGAVWSALNNCTLTANSALFSGGGDYGGTLNNCIVYYNTAPTGSNYSGSTFSYSCTAPLPGGAGNTNVDPQLASASHLSAGSPCRGAGSAAYTSGVDIDGESWANPPSIGCDEYVSGAMTGALSAEIWESSTNTVPGVALTFGALTRGPASTSQWSFGDATMTTNQGVASHSWAALGDYPVVLTAYNETYPMGVSAAVTVHVVEQVAHYVSANSANPLPPYTSWATAARNLQEAVDAVFSAPNATVLVSNGVYRAEARLFVYNGGRPTNQVVLVDKPITVRSVNGPAVTALLGQNGVRCALLTNGPVLSGFTLTNGNGYGGGGVFGDSNFRPNGPIFGPVLTNCLLISNTGTWGGGGAYFCILNNCVLSRNSSPNSSGGGAFDCALNSCTLTGNSTGFSGGGAYNSTLNNCLVLSNTASGYGGGVSSGTLSNCTLIGNRALGNPTYGGGGGSDLATLYNCIIFYNSAASGPNNYGATLTYCCTTPRSGTGSITNAPLFVDLANNNLRLQSDSPCINAGNNVYVGGSTDLDGNPRILGGTVDMGAYECQSPALLDYFNWLQSYGLPTAASALYADSDGDGMNNWQEWMAGTNPTNAGSLLLLAAPEVGAGGVTLAWASVTNRTYYVERATNLAPPPAFFRLQTNIPGLPDTTTFTDTAPPLAGPALYRIGVRQ
jgi:hypothetical protein